MFETPARMKPSLDDAFQYWLKIVFELSVMENIMHNSVTFHANGSGSSFAFGKVGS